MFEKIKLRSLENADKNIKVFILIIAKKSKI